MNVLALFFVLTTGIYLVVGAAIISTKTVAATVVFKVAPAVLGVGCIWAATLMWLAK